MSFSESQTIEEATVTVPYVFASYSHQRDPDQTAGLTSPITRHGDMTVS